ncbi:hypothetical protein TRFO_28731 [Tritrichomonas foetus]|uniref:Uncharacterized protein n=1 Tax=Tritrichomonas foetus TaxID=1144522 RepID=A0A1J4JXR2_9EUKA|nr:hypothetical protein TRFO_28731 [Tritrichomonas foetus]|eukprot:OHT03943.1 hypothetical protein TRFO_28731 [Tritrichomonas foetus]
MFQRNSHSSLMLYFPPVQSSLHNVLSDRFCWQPKKQPHLCQHFHEYFDTTHRLQRMNSNHLLSIQLLPRLHHGNTLGPFLDIFPGQLYPIFGVRSLRFRI